MSAIRRLSARERVRYGRCHCIIQCRLTSWDLPIIISYNSSQFTVTIVCVKIASKEWIPFSEFDSLVSINTRVQYYNIGE